MKSPRHKSGAVATRSLQGTPVTFNAFGEMASFVFPWTTWYYQYDPWGNPVGISDSSGAVWRQFVPLQGRSQAVYSTGSQEMYFLHPNLLGSVTMNTNQTGAPVGDLLIYPWGMPWTSMGDLSVWQYAQFQNDKSLIDPTPTRWDDPSMGRWLSPDPLGGDISNPQSLNRYAYVLNSPVTLTDPSGLGPFDFNGGNCSDPAFADSHAECQGPGSPYCIATNDPECGFPIGFPAGHGGGGGGGTGGGSSAPPAGSIGTTPAGPLSETQMGAPSGFVSTAQAIEQLGISASPFEIEVLSICALSPGCQEVLLGAAVAGGGYLVYKGVQAGISVYKAKGGKQNVADTGVVQQAQGLMQQNPGMTICEALQRLMDASKGNPAQQQKIKATQKQYGCRRHS